MAYTKKIENLSDTKYQTDTPSDNRFSWDTFDLDKFFEETKKVHEIITRQDADMAEKNKDGNSK